MTVPHLFSSLIVHNANTSEIDSQRGKYISFSSIYFLSFKFTDVDGYFNYVHTKYRVKRVTTLKRL